MADEEIHRLKTCSKCGLTKPLHEFRPKRAKCQACRNIRRREHYALPEVNAVKNAKRKDYQRRVDYLAKRQLRRRTDPIFQMKERLISERYRQRPEVMARIKLQRAKHRALPAVKAHALWAAVSLRAKKKSLPFDLTEDWLSEKVLAGRCEITGLSFDYGTAPNGWRYNPRSPSVDQIVAGGGYTKANCRVVITALNNALSQYGDDQFEELAAAFLKSRGFRIIAP